MMAINFPWARDQLTKARVRVGTGDAVLSLLSDWDNLQVDPARAEEVLDTFRSLALGHALVEEGEGVWVNAQPGMVRMGDTVRVKKTAYDGDVGSIHNGRVLRVVAVRYGDIITRSIDEREPKLDGAHYSPHKLEKKINN